MNFKTWRIWFYKLPLSKKWFVAIILLRPYIDQFWEAKSENVFSPLQILGALFPILVLLSIAGSKSRKTEISLLLKILFILIFVNDLTIYLYYPTLANIAEGIRHITFIFIYFYLFYFIQNENDFERILQTFIYASFIPFGLLIYEVFIGPINPEYLSAGRGGGARYSGGYADIMTYAIYFMGSFGIINYFLLKNFYSKISSINLIIYSFVAFFSFWGLFFIKHSASWAVFTTILLLFAFYQTKKASGLFLMLIVLVVLASSSGIGDVYSDQIYPLISKEFKVFAGNASIESSFNGRMSRWLQYYGVWLQMPNYTIITGVALSGFPEIKHMVSGGMHNDFVRFFFLTGIVGLIVYLLFLFAIFKRRKYLSVPDKFISLFAILTIVLYSVSAVPSIYFNLQYIIMAIFVHVIKKSSSKSYVQSYNTR